MRMQPNTRREYAVAHANRSAHAHARAIPIKQMSRRGPRSLEMVMSHTLGNMIAGTAGKSATPPPAEPDSVWSMTGAGSEPTVADCTKAFPLHDNCRVCEPEAVACGAVVPNIGQVNATHLEDDGETFSFTFQHATVPCPIASAANRAGRICE